MILTIAFSAQYPNFRVRFIWPKTTNKVDRLLLEKETVAEVLRSINLYYYSN